MRDIDQFVVVTPWYPSPDHPYAGNFVKQWAKAMGHSPDRTTVIHLRRVRTARKGWQGRGSSTDSFLVDAAGQLLEVEHDGVQVEHTTDEVGRVLRVSYGLAKGSSFLEAIDKVTELLRMHGTETLASADVVHAHVGIPTACAVADVIGTEVALISVEHASFLKQALTNPELRNRYASMLERCTQHLMVGEGEARRLRADIPQYAHKMTAVGNPVDVESFSPFSTRSEHFDKWLYVGNVLEAKGVDHVIRAFAHLVRRHQDRQPTLTVVGKNELPEHYSALVKSLKVQQAVSFVPPVPHEKLPEIFAAADVLVHLSERETFGVTVVEAAMAGLPVVATACGGPEETMWYARAMGTAQILPVHPRPGRVVEAVMTLEHTFTPEASAAVRDHLDHRFGSRDFGRRVRELSDRNPRHVDDGVERNAVVIATGPGGAQSAVHINQALLRAGATVTYLSGSRSDLQETDRRVNRRSLWPALKWSPLRWTESAIASGLSLGFLGIRFVLRRAAQLKGPVGAVAAKSYWTVVQAHARVLRALNRLHVNVIDRRVYQSTSGSYVARFAMKKWPDLVRRMPDLVIGCDPKAALLASKLANAVPHAELLLQPSQDVVEHAAHHVIRQTSS